MGAREAVRGGVGRGNGKKMGELQRIAGKGAEGEGGAGVGVEVEVVVEE